MSEERTIDTESAGGPDSPGSRNGLTRRDFVVGAGLVGASAVFGGTIVRGIMLPDEIFAIPASQGYIVVDTKKCSGCESCMLACAVTHHGRASLSLARMQVQTDPFAAFPSGVVQNQCRQCPSAPCVMACPTGANHIDAEHGNVRAVDENKCIGCERCVQACPFTPSRVAWNFEERHAQKCDLCTDTPFWKEEGGIGGKQACVEFCPLHAVAFTPDIPMQNGDEGYQVNLRKDSPVWSKFGLPTSDSGDFTAAELGGTAAH